MDVMLRFRFWKDEFSELIEQAGLQVFRPSGKGSAPKSQFNILVAEEGDFYDQLACTETFLRLHRDLIIHLRQEQPDKDAYPQLDIVVSLKPGKPFTNHLFSTRILSLLAEMDIMLNISVYS